MKVKTRTAHKDLELEATRMAACLCTAIDAVTQATAYARKKDPQFVFSCENISSIALSIYISATRREKKEFPKWKEIADTIQLGRNFSTLCAPRQGWSQSLVAKGQATAVAPFCTRPQNSHFGRNRPVWGTFDAILHDSGTGTQSALHRHTGTRRTLADHSGIGCAADRSRAREKEIKIQMKYLLIKPAKYSLGNHEIQEFATSQELTAHLLEKGMDPAAIVAKRVGLDLQISEWLTEKTEEEF
jgi:hypothetical protein